MLWNIVVFALIGLLAGGASRLFYPGRRLTRILGTMVIGMIAAVGGGMVSWTWWPAVSGQFHTGNLIMSLLAAVTVILLWAVFIYKRSLSEHRNAPR